MQTKRPNPQLILYHLQIREYLPTRDFKGVVAILEKMLNFMKMTSVGTIGSNKGIKVRHLFFKVTMSQFMMNNEHFRLPRV